MTSAAEDLAAIRQVVERACVLLADASPPALDQSTDELDQAVRQFAAFRGSLGSGGAGADGRSEAERLRMAVRRAARLLQGGAEFFGGWNRRLGALMGGYTVRGDAAPVSRLGHLSLHG